VTFAKTRVGIPLFACIVRCANSRQCGIRNCVNPLGGGSCENLSLSFHSGPRFSIFRNHDRTVAAKAECPDGAFKIKMSAFPSWPAALRLDQAAAYCGLSVETFKAVCPVKPIAFTDSSRGNRYLKAKLDDWLASLDPNGLAEMPTRRFGEKLNGDQRAASRA
jgi:hypothetical protein